LTVSRRTCARSFFNFGADKRLSHYETMPHGKPTSLQIQAEAIGEKPLEWAWAIYCGTDRFLITRSRAEFSSRAEALEAGGTAAVDVARKLRIHIVEQDVG
jgi:hypothetical protein